MAYLLDTHIFLWWITNDPRLSETAKEIICDGKNSICFSSVSAFEIAIKANLGRLSEVGDPTSSVPFHAQRNNFEELHLTSRAALQVFKLPDIHNDPFDRLLIAQCLEHKLTLISADKLIPKYDILVVS
jgi:PIN domain nuclease of toxin-antitoxin system